MEIDLDKKRLLLSVVELCQQTAIPALGGRGFSLSGRGRLGSSAHRRYQEKQRKNAAYRSEVHLDIPLTSSQFPDWEIRLRGRLDGLIEELDRFVVEEIKTCILSHSDFQNLRPADFPLHLRQLEAYLYLVSIVYPQKSCAGRLLYINLASARKRQFEVPFHREDAEIAIQQALAFLLTQERRRAREKGIRKEIAPLLRFPYEHFRIGQETIIEAVSNALQQGSQLLLEAPTGLGKTAAVLFAALRYALDQGKKVLFLTAKTTQQELVYRTAQFIKADRPFPRIQLLRAKQKLCPQPEAICHPDECSFLTDYYVKLHHQELRDRFLESGEIHPDAILQAGSDFEICPYELQLSFCPDADLIIGDYNYVFDPECRLNVIFEHGSPSECLVIVDEAHNLPPRARSYYSAGLSWTSVQAAQTALSVRGIADFDSIFEGFIWQFQYYVSEAPRQPDPYPIELSPSAWRNLAADFENFLLSHWNALTSSADAGRDDPVFSLQRSLERFLRCLKFEGPPFAHLLRRKPIPNLEVLCLDAASFLSDTFSELHAAVCMSATLQPLEAYQRLLGLKTDALTISLPNPFPVKLRQIMVDPSVTTIYRERRANIPAIAQRIQLFYKLVQRNVIVFFPSFEFLKQVCSHLDVENLYVHEDGWNDQQRSLLLTHFQNSKHGLLATVAGSVFSEGIDLPGKAAEAAIIVGVPLPQVNPENELKRAYYDQQGDDGFEYAYLYPGMQRVIQAAGRIIRSETDQGIILLLDRRYAQPNYQRLFPQDWYERDPRELITRDWKTNL
ncbi:MAG: helicase C-terminal domain-containing protein [bacterium]